MPRHDYTCLYDGTVLRDQVRSITEGAQANRPLCPSCGNRMAWIPRAAFDVRSDGDPQFSKFTIRDGRNHLVEIDSLHTLRRVERESEQLARNGEGQQIALRAYANNRSNHLDNVFGEPPPSGLTAEGKRKFGLKNAATPLAPVATTESGEPDIPFGPGVTDSNATALK